MCVCVCARESGRESESEGDCAMCLLNEELVDCDLWSQNKHEAVADEELFWPLKNCIPESFWHHLKLCWNNLKSLNLCPQIFLCEDELTLLHLHMHPYT